MVVYSLSCGNSHVFEGWFGSPGAFDTQVQAESLSCPLCGSSDVARRPSAPNIAKHRDGAPGAMKENASLEMLRTLQAKVLKYVINHTEDVGKSFPDEARRIHRQEAPERAIRGQATQREANALRDEGIDVALLPMVPVARDQLH